jgi:hypothetical protein
MTAIFKEPVALVIGAGSGIDFATAGHHTLAIECDVTDENQVATMVATTGATREVWTSPTTTPASTSRSPRRPRPKGRTSTWSPGPARVRPPPGPPRRRPGGCEQRDPAQHHQRAGPRYAAGVGRGPGGGVQGRGARPVPTEFELNPGARPFSGLLPDRRRVHVTDVRVDLGRGQPLAQGEEVDHQAEDCYDQ